MSGKTHAPLLKSAAYANASAAMSLLVVRRPAGRALDVDADAVPQTYSSMFLPPPPVRAGQGSSTEAFAAVPPS